MCLEMMCEAVVVGTALWGHDNNKCVGKCDGQAICGDTATTTCLQTVLLSSDNSKAQHTWSGCVLSNGSWKRGHG